MWEYYPPVLYLAPGSGGITAERYNEIVPEHRSLQFEYAVVGLPDLMAQDHETR